MTDKIYTDPLGRKYEVLTGADFNKFFGGNARQKYDDDERFLIPIHEPDDKLEFPSNPQFDDTYSWVGSGTAIHKVTRGETYGPRLPPKLIETDEGLRVEGEKGFAATDIHVFDETDWFGECWGVMGAHGWNGPRGGLAAHIVDHVRTQFGPCEVTKAKLKYGGDWEVRIAELAATQLVRPLSRLWYAVNMMALYYCHHDDLRLGYLWAEYRMRMSAEKDALRGEQVVKSARDGGLARRASKSAQSSSVIAAMEKRIADGHSTSNAARLAYNGGLGASPEANRKLWTRYRRK